MAREAPGELAAEIVAAGLEVTDRIALEGPLWLLPDLARIRADPQAAALALRVAGRISRDPGALANSPHFIVVARRTGTTERATP